ncbi:MAG: uncharacterized protein KVP18_002347 [Porospora cf. gigantea A]|uniref:uncharacterized protein n=1 Tax=Porospora cf. gigantea A TaxID=2853593 RepID=UPI003559E53D|nr:MAG: hypothetical protein KVP18_002347 [Porospora cf. gigantea A]
MRFLGDLGERGDEGELLMDVIAASGLLSADLEGESIPAVSSFRGILKYACILIVPAHAQGEPAYLVWRALVSPRLSSLLIYKLSAPWLFFVTDLRQY